MIIKCDNIKADEPTVNNRIYPRKELQNAIDEYYIHNNKLCMLRNNLTENFRENIDLEKVCCKVNNIWINDLTFDDGFILTDIKILDTPCGDILKDKKLKGYPVFLGNIEDNIIFDLKLVRIDIGLDD